MPAVLRHPVATACLLTTLLGLLVACTSTFAYRHADTLLLWKIDQYLDLTREQRTLVKGRLKELLAHHRREALPLYEGFLRQVKDQAADGLTRNELDWMFARYQELRADLIARVLPDGARLLASLSESQVQVLEQALHKDWARADRRVREEWNRRVAKRTSGTLRMAKEWLGSLTRDQERVLREFSPSLPDGEPGRVEYAKAWQQDLLQVLRLRPDRDRISERLQAWLLEPHTIAPEYSRLLAEMQEGLKGLVLALDPAVTPEQRGYALAKLQALIDDVRALETS